MSTKLVITLIITAIIIFIALDLYLLLESKSNTFSLVLRRLSIKHSILPWGLGMLAMHWFHPGSEFEEPESIALVFIIGLCTWGYGYSFGINPYLAFVIGHVSGFLWRAGPNLGF